MMGKFKMTMTAATLVAGLAGCTTVADLAGYDSASLNAKAAADYSTIVRESVMKGQVDTKSAVAKRVRTVFNRLLPYANLANQTGQPFKWELTVVKSDELNAWAMPGGKMVVYTGIVKQLNLTDDELAAVIGHEMSHALYEHSKSQAGQQIITNVALQVGTKVVAKETGMDAGAVGKAAGILGEYGVNLPFSRSQETDADLGGLKLMAQAGYNPQAAVTVWQKMNGVHNNNNIINKLASTHPTNNDRIANIQKELPNVMPLYEASQTGKKSAKVKKR